MAFKPVLRKNQNELLRDHFIASHQPSISGIEAAALFRIRALPRRIKDLEEKHGMSFKRENHTDSTGQRYVRYVHLPMTQALSFADR
jgi:hypothetical protein